MPPPPCLDRPECWSGQLTQAQSEEGEAVISTSPSTATGMSAGSPAPEGQYWGRVVDTSGYVDSAAFATCPSALEMACLQGKGRR